MAVVRAGAGRGTNDGQNGKAGNETGKQNSEGAFHALVSVQPVAEDRNRNALLPQIVVRRGFVV